MNEQRGGSPIHIGESLKDIGDRLTGDAVLSRSVLKRREAQAEPRPIEGKRLGIPEKFWGVEATDIRFVYQPPENLLVLGRNGVGKSHSAAVLAFGLKARWVSMFPLMVEIRSSFSGRGDRSEAELLEWLCGFRYLVIDDLLAANRTDFGLSWILGLMEQRDRPGYGTIVTCDQRWETINQLDSSLGSRLAGFKHVVLEGDDRRIK